MNFKRSIFGIYHPTHKLALLFSDLMLLGLAFYIASKYRLNIDPSYLSLEYIGLNLIIVTSLFVGGGYTSNVIENKPRLPLNTFFIVLSAIIPSLLFIYFLGPERFTALLGRGVFPVAIGIFGVFSVISRFGLNHAFHDATAKRQILLLGNVFDKKRIDQSLNNTEFKFKLEHCEYLSQEPKKVKLISAIVISPDHTPDEFEQQQLIDLRLMGVPIFSLSDFFESFLFVVPVQEINNDWFIRAEGFTMLHSSVATRIKRAVDVIAF